MADVNKLAPIIFQWEGGWSDVKEDRGGKTNMGITLDTWKSQGYDKDGDGDIDADDLRIISREDVVGLLRKGYWDRWRADYICNQSIANILVDWTWNSGTNGIKIPQRILGLKADGIVGPITLNTVNASNQRNLFDLIKSERISFVNNIVRKDPSQQKFLKGWLNRINSFIYVD